MLLTSPLILYAIMGCELIDWWEELFTEMLKVALHNVDLIEEHCNGSDEAMCLLMEASEQLHFIQQAYHDWRDGRVHVGLGL